MKMKRLVRLGTVLMVIAIAISSILTVSASSKSQPAFTQTKFYDIPAGTTFGWINAVPVMTDSTHFQWVNGRPFIIMAASTSASYNLTNAPTSIDFGVIQPSTEYYAYGSAPSNPVTDAQCTFTITNSQANAIKVNINMTNFTGGAGWTLGVPDGTHTRVIAYYSGENPASGVTLTTSDQAFISSLAGSATIKWDFSWETPTNFVDGVQKTAQITLTGVVP